jgi:hypothetical protein
MDEGGRKMTVKELINMLLDCNMNAEVRLCDDVKFEDEHCGICVGSLYHIDAVKMNGNSLCELHFDNRHHFARRKEEE